MKLSILSTGAVIPFQEENWADTLPKSLKKRTPKVWQLSHLAVARALENCSQKPTAIVCTTALGALNEAVKFLNKIADTGLGAPRQFIASVHNSMAGKLALDFNIKGANLTLCDSHTSLASGIITATLLKDEVVLLIIAEEHLPILDEIYKDSSDPKNFTADPKEGAVAFVVTRNSVEGAVKISATAPKPTVREGHSEDNSFFKPAFDLFNAVEAKEQCVINSFSISANASSLITVSL